MVELTLAEALSRAIEARNRGDGAAIATVIANRSEVLVPVTARMVVLGDGTISGSLHPILDTAVAARALVCLSRKESKVQSFTLEATGASFTGIQGGGVEVFIEVIASPPHLVVVGAGHIAVPLAEIAKLLDFRVTVIDDRAEFANRDRFPRADHIVVGPYRACLRAAVIDTDTFVVLVTRGHVHDSASLEEIIDSDAAYIGMIGSRRRVRTVLEHLRGVTPDARQIDRVYAPIGLDIGAQTPEEIAVAVMAEIVKVRRGGSGRSLASPKAADD